MRVPTCAATCCGRATIPAPAISSVVAHRTEERCFRISGAPNDDAKLRAKTPIAGTACQCGGEWGKCAAGTSMNFISDNAYGAAPEIIAAVAQANSGAAGSYGDDEITARVTRRFCEIFGREVAVF